MESVTTNSVMISREMRKHNVWLIAEPDTYQAQHISPELNNFVELCHPEKNQVPSLPWKFDFKNDFDRKIARTWTTAIWLKNTMDLTTGWFRFSVLLTPVKTVSRHQSQVHHCQRYLTIFQANERLSSKILHQHFQTCVLAEKYKLPPNRMVMNRVVNNNVTDTITCNESPSKFSLIMVCNGVFWSLQVWWKCFVLFPVLLQISCKLKHLSKFVVLQELTLIHQDYSIASLVSIQESSNSDLATVSLSAVICR